LIGPLLPSSVPYPKNAPGGFYVAQNECIACGAPKAVAPDLIDFDEDSNGLSHCYFKKQPVHPDEITRAIKALDMCCCGSYHYSGHNQEIRKQLKAAGYADVIDNR